MRDTEKGQKEIYGEWTKGGRIVVSVHLDELPMSDLLSVLEMSYRLAGGESWGACGELERVSGGRSWSFISDGILQRCGCKSWVSILKDNIQLQTSSGGP